MFLCKYKNIFGKPNEGSHKYRLFDIALVDLLPTIVIILIISYLSKYTISDVAITVTIITIIIHRLFCVNTTINKIIFGTI